jgi:hypothetical protein
VSRTVSRVTLVVAGVLSLATVGAARGWRPVSRVTRLFASQQSTSAADRIRQLQALRVGGLQAAAAATGQFVGTVTYPTGGGPLNLGELASLSRAVVIAHSETNACALSSSGREIFTYFQLRIDRVLSGDLTAGDLVTMALIGGKVAFPNGTWAALNTGNIRLPEPGHSLLVFLRPAPQEMVTGNERLLTNTAGRAFVPAAAPLGLFDLSAGANGLNYVMPAGSPRSPLAVTLHKSKLGPDAFVALVASTIGKAGSTVAAR